jgi:hypothetical protein
MALDAQAVLAQVAAIGSSDVRLPARRRVRYVAEKEDRKIELTQEQLQTLDAPDQPAVAVDPRTGQEYLLIRRDIYEKVRSVLAPFGRAWDSPADDDLIRKDV